MRFFRWKQLLLVPVLATLLSAVILLVQILHRRFFSNEETSPEVKSAVTTDASVVSTCGIVARIREHASTHGGLTIYAFKIARLLGCLALFSLSLVGVLAKKNGPRNLGWDVTFHADILPNVAVTITFVRSQSFLSSCISLKTTCSCIIHS
jgi:hypothetical protein